MNAKTPSCVIADWLALTRAGQWTPMEAAREVVGRLKLEGYAIVPKEPTEEMIDAGEMAVADNIIEDTALETYRAMIGTIK